ncbi:MAG: hypothetical protein NC307_11445 [Roseburia sp.]|nr:hypothetical protein [Roseburia sp.]
MGMELKESNHPDPNATGIYGNHSGALDEHCQRMQRWAENDRRALGIIETGLDVPVSHIKGKGDRMEITVDISKEIKNVEDLYFLIDSLKGTMSQMEHIKRKEIGKGVKIEIGILEDELDAITWMDAVQKIVNEATEDPGVLNALETVRFFLDRVYEVARNEQIIQEDKIQSKGIGNAKFPPRKKILSDQEKKGLSNEQIFMKEYGLYTSFAINRYWSSVFKEIYGCSPSLL